MYNRLFHMEQKKAELNGLNEKATVLPAFVGSLDKSQLSY